MYLFYCAALICALFFLTCVCRSPASSGILHCDQRKPMFPEYLYEWNSHKTQTCLSFLAVSSTNRFIAQHCNDHKCTLIYYRVCARNLTLPTEIMRSLLIPTLDLYLPLSPADCTTPLKGLFWTYRGAIERGNVTLSHFVDSSRHSRFIYYKPIGGKWMSPV